MKIKKKSTSKVKVRLYDYGALSSNIITFRVRVSCSYVEDGVNDACMHWKIT
jgi:hypothetical protein